MQTESSLAQFINQSIEMKVIDGVGMCSFQIQEKNSNVHHQMKATDLVLQKKKPKETESRASVAVATTATALPV